MSTSLIVSAKSLVESLFLFYEARHRRRHAQFVQDMVTGILGSQSTLVSNIARFLNEKNSLRSTENRLCGMLCNAGFDVDDLRLRTLEIGSRLVGKEDVIAFDPGDLSKDYATKMENIYRVHDGSKDGCSNGFEDFSVEAIQWKDGKKFHIPLYQKLITASCADYISQNRQIADAIRTVYEHIGERGIWTFDRGHDRSRIFEKALLPLPIRWILRAKENRTVVQQADGTKIGLMDLAKSLELSPSVIRLLEPQKSGYLHAAWTSVYLEMDAKQRPLTLLAIKDERNAQPVVLLTNLECLDETQALVIFGYYLQRWGKEEGYRFIKSFLNSENIRTIKWESTQALAFLSFLTYFFVTMFHRSNPGLIEQLAEERLKHFHSIDLITFKYYRIAQLMRMILCEQLGRWHVLPGLTEVG